MNETILVTGANRGLGLAVTKVFLSQGDKVVAACRRPKEAQELEKIKASHGDRLEVVEMDADSSSSVTKAFQQLSATTPSLDVLMNVAGISPAPADAPLEKLEMDQCRKAFETNSLGPIRVTQTFLPMLVKSKRARVVNFTSGLASIAGKNSAGFYAYGASKTALNMFTRTMAFDLKDKGVTCVVLDPGWVKTDMGGPNAFLTPEQSSAAIVKTVNGLDPSKTGTFLYNDGQEIPW